ncbi:hypothetical protein B0H17DRAFT_1150116 [Mycena rosella]|uniref:Uncharacterized protein n=1 Tax=Mycena rosella TaxID=1033263 RepID=A0AAD7BVP5_MYCRO|nr:hypothetical protein B0H17DRAFT_1150116 [Mycena rosella]
MYLPAYYWGSPCVFLTVLPVLHAPLTSPRPVTGVMPPDGDIRTICLFNAQGPWLDGTMGFLQLDCRTVANLIYSTVEGFAADDALVFVQEIVRHARESFGDWESGDSLNKNAAAQVLGLGGFKSATLYLPRRTPLVPHAPKHPKLSHGMQPLKNYTRWFMLLSGGNAIYNRHLKTPVVGGADNTPTFL